MSTPRARPTGSDPASCSDDVLAQRVPADADAFAELYRRYFPRVYRWAAARAGVGAAEDIAQAVFVEVLRSIRQFRGGGRFAGWLFGVARHVAADEIAARVRGGVPAPVGGEDASPDAPTITPESVEDRLVVVGLLARLPPRQRAAVLLHYFADLSVADTAAALGAPVGATKAVLHRALVTLKRLLAAAGSSKE